VAAYAWAHAPRRAGELKGQKTNRPPRTVDLLAPLKQDLAEWRLASGRPPDAFVFRVRPRHTTLARRLRNWRKRDFRPAAESAGLPTTRPYDLRHSFASLMLHEGRDGVVDLASELGHGPTMTLNRTARGTKAERQRSDRRCPHHGPKPPPPTINATSQEAEDGRDLQSRHPDSNRGPLHYE
jgi:integrase